MSFIGQSIPRREDVRLVTGRGAYADDHARPGQAWLAVVRSTHAHADIVKLDTAAARALPGTLMVCTGQDYQAENLGLPLPMKIYLGPVSRLKDGRLINPANTMLPADRVRYAGEPIAFVVAESAQIARDAAALVEVEFRAQPAVTDLEAALGADAPQIWDEAPGNLCCEIEVGDAQACAAAFDGAAHVASIELTNNRVIGSPMEPRAALADFDSESGVMTLITGTQMPHDTRNALAHVFNAPPDKVHLISPDMGGGFGVRAQCFPEYIFALWAARRLGRPVKWLGDRSECFLSDTHARDNVSRGSLALDADGRILGLKAYTVANLGAYPGYAGALVPIAAGPRVQTGTYRVPALHVLIQVAFTNTATVAPYRGAGQPEAVYLIERLLDIAASEMGIDRVELRRRNAVLVNEYPYSTAAGATYDSGDYPGAMAIAQDKSGWDGFEKRRWAAKRNGKLRGIGLANYIQVSGGAPNEYGEVRVRPDQTIEFRIGTHSHGQGHETTYAQILASEFDLPMSHFAIVQGDTASVARGGGTHGSRALYKSGQIIGHCTKAVIEKARRVAAILHDVDPDLISYDHGELRVRGTNRGSSLFEIAAFAAERDDLPDDLRGGLRAEQDLMQHECNYPGGTHVCEVEIDPDTGEIEIVRYVSVDDAGRLVNPLVAFGQMHGGIAQGIGQALGEHIVYDSDGQLLTGSFMDYAMPRAADVPPFEVTFQEVASPTSPLGVKGIGESGPTGAPPAVISAIIDALKDFGIRHLDMPVTPERIWRAMREARART